MQVKPLRFVLFLLLFISAAASAQIENVHATNVAGRVVITYDLNGTADQKYIITIYSSHNNYASPLRFVVGDAGRDVAVGKGKRVEWDIAQELVTYSGNITFRVRGEVIATPLTFKTPAANATVKKGKSTQITWSGGRQGQPIKVELLQDGTTVQSIKETTNTGVVVWDVPKDLAKGVYQVRITGAGENAISQPFNIKPKPPLLWIIAPIVVVGIIIAVLPKGGGEKPDDEAKDLPDAPIPQD